MSKYLVKLGENSRKAFKNIDIKTKNNLIIKFPLENLKEAIIIVNKIINNKNYNNNIIDLRVPNQLILSNE